MRIFGAIFVVAALALGAYMFAGSAQHESPASTQVQAAEQQAEAAAGTSNFQGAAVQLEAYRATNGSYEGAALPPSFGVTVVRADASSYCLQTGSGTAVEHLNGPGGAPQSGPC